jgi:hypothetical protein
MYLRSDLQQECQALANGRAAGASGAPVKRAKPSDFRFKKRGSGGKRSTRVLTTDGLGNLTRFDIYLMLLLAGV